MGLTQLNRQEQFLLTTRINERRAASITGLNLLKSIYCDEKKYSIDERRLKANLKRKNFQCTTMVKMAKQCGTWIQRKEQGRNPKRRSLTFYNHEAWKTQCIPAPLTLQSCWWTVDHIPAQAANICRINYVEFIHSCMLRSQTKE